MKNMNMNIINQSITNKTRRISNKSYSDYNNKHSLIKKHEDSSSGYEDRDRKDCYRGTKNKKGVLSQKDNSS